jgi:ferrochelatase
MQYQNNTDYTHGSPTRTAVMLVQLGTPDAPTESALRRYLKEFLSDPRVVEIPRAIWALILHGFILRVRPAQSAKKYASVWINNGADQGSPLRVYSEKQSKMLRGYLGHAGVDVDVVLAMRYGQPGVQQVIQELAERDIERLLVVPMYPQYSATTTASVYDAVGLAMSKLRNVPELRYIKHWHDDPAYIDALAANVRRSFERDGQPDILVVSFHGVPRLTLTLGDPYHCECLKTARLLAERLRWPDEKMRVTFQSRFGKAEWLKPYTQSTLEELGAKGVQHVSVVCPGFVADCLETLEEVGDEVRQAFLDAGGKKFTYIPALNDSAEWINALAALVRQHMQGWDTGRLTDADKQELTQSQARAKALGASK